MSNRFGIPRVLEFILKHGVVHIEDVGVEHCRLELRRDTCVRQIKSLSKIGVAINDHISTPRHVHCALVCGHWAIITANENNRRARTSVWTARR